MRDFDFFLKSAVAFAAEKVVPAKDLIACLDLTSLNASDTEVEIAALCQASVKHSVAAVCVAPHFVSFAASCLTAKACQLATVANFPSGDESLEQVLTSIEASLKAGATEIDVVVPYQRFLADQDTRAVQRFVKACKDLCGASVTLKTILESGLIEDHACLERLSLSALEGGADSLKTSTGKVALGASLEAACVMLGALKAFGEPTRGFKAAGGVRTYAEAKAYWVLAQLIMGEFWPKASCFRLGASTLLNELSKIQP